jgi:hypothetical protein
MIPEQTTSQSRINVVHGRPKLARYRDFVDRERKYLLHFKHDRLAVFPLLEILGRHSAQ